MQRDPTRRSRAHTAPGPDPTALDDDRPQRNADVRDDAAARWLAGELEAVVELLHAARLTLKAGHVPAVHLRRAAVRLACLDAAVADDLALVRAMPGADDAVEPVRAGGRR